MRKPERSFPMIRIINTTENLKAQPPVENRRLYLYEAKMLQKKQKNGFAGGREFGSVLNDFIAAAGK